MTKKQRKRTIVKRLLPVLLAIILGAASVPAALAGEITESEYSAPEQKATAAAAFPEIEQDEKETVTEKIENIISNLVKGESLSAAYPLH